MITLRKIVYDIRGLIRDAKSDDKHFTDRQIAFWVTTLRARLLKERIDRGQSISSSNYQAIEPMPVNVVSSISGIPNIDVGCKILRVGPFPDILEDIKGNPIIHDFRSLNTSSFITIMEKPQALRVKDNKYTSKHPVAFKEGEFIYILGKDLYISDVKLDAVFEDPDAANKLITGSPLGLDDYYPISASLLDIIKEIIISKNLALYVQLPEDRANDAQTAY